MNNYLYVIFIHPFVIIYKCIYYLIRYSILFKTTYNRYRQRCAERNLEKDQIKYVIATTYVLLICQVIIDMGCKKRFNVESTDECLTIIDLYFLVINIDNEFDAIDSSIQKQKIINDVFFAVEEAINNPTKMNNKILKNTFSDTTSTIFVQFISDHINSWKKNYRIKFIESINLLRNAYLLEAHATNRNQAWSASYSISVATIEFFICGLNMLNGNIKLIKSHRNILYSFMFAGNIVDDWMDYYWTGEDHGKPCFLEFLRQEMKYKIFRFPLFYYPYSLFLSASHLSKTIFAVQKNIILSAKVNWVLPVFMLLVFFTGPRSIFFHLKNKI